MAMLEVVNLTKYFGGLGALNKVHFEVQGEEILGVIGPNGAGKTTLFNCINGVYRQSEGRILFKGEEISDLKPNKRAKKGISRTFQNTTLFNQFSVFENVILGFHLHSNITPSGILFNTKGMRDREREIREEASKILDFMNLRPYRDERAVSLSHGHQRALEIAIALATRPVLLLLDEPVAGVSADETGRLITLIRRIRDQGVTILLVEHDMKAVMGLCDRIVVLNYGTKIAQGTPEEIRKDPTVITAYLGSEDSDVF